MKRIFILCALLAMAYPAAAAPKWLTAVPRAVGRTSKDLVTFKYPLVDLAFACELAADFADARTTANFTSRGILEQNWWLYGQHPDFHKVALIDLGSSFALAAASNSMNEYADHIGLSKWDWERDLIPAGQVIDFSLTGRAAYHNTK